VAKAHTVSADLGAASTIETEGSLLLGHAGGDDQVFLSCRFALWTRRMLCLRRLGRLELPGVEAIPCKARMSEHELRTTGHALWQPRPVMGDSVVTAVRPLMIRKSR
jgi:hypothetical protein